MAILIGLLCCAACGQNNEPTVSPIPPPAPAAEPVAKPGVEPAAKPAARNISDAASIAAPSPIPLTTQQLLVSITDDWTATDTELFWFERQSATTPWQQLNSVFKGTIGKAGLAWGLGLHDIPPSSDEPVKREGDGKSPAGVFAIGSAYGYESAPTNTTLFYQKTGANWRCISDSASRYYNRVINTSQVDKDWKGAEIVRRKNDDFRLIIEVDHNHSVPSELAPVPQGGSCILLHIWRKPGEPTIGCTAMSQPDLESLMAWLDPSKQPVMLALPRARYESLREDWLLPLLPQ